MIILIKAEQLEQWQDVRISCRREKSRAGIKNTVSCVLAHNVFSVRRNLSTQNR